jgi:hypothetical protein
MGIWKFVARPSLCVSPPERKAGNPLSAIPTFTEANNFFG